MKGVGVSGWDKAKGSKKVADTVKEAEGVQGRAMGGVE